MPRIAVASAGGTAPAVSGGASATASGASSGAIATLLARVQRFASERPVEAAAAGVAAVAVVGLVGYAVYAAVAGGGHAPASVVRHLALFRARQLASPSPSAASAARR